MPFLRSDALRTARKHAIPALSVILSFIPFSAIWPYISYLSAVTVLLSFLVTLSSAYLFLTVLEVAISLILRKGINRRHIAFAVVATLFIASTGVFYQLSVASARASEGINLDYPNTPFMFLDAGSAKVMTVCEDNVLIEYIGIWDKYLELHKELGSFGFSGGPEEVAEELLRDAMKEGYVPDFNGKLAPGPWMPIISFWNALGYRGPWWAWEALGAVTNFTTVEIEVNADIAPLHVAVVTGYEESPEGLRIIVDWCGVERFWEDTSVPLESVYSSIGSIILVFPGNRTPSLLEGLEGPLRLEDLESLIRQLIGLGMPVIIAVDSNLFIERAFGPLAFAGMLSTMLAVPFIPFFR